MLTVRHLQEKTGTNMIKYLMCASLSLIPAAHAHPLIIVGGSAAGTAAIRTLEKESYKGPVVWITGQQELPYDLTKIGSLIDDSKSIEKITLIHPDKSPLSLTVIKKRVKKIQPDKHSLSLEDGTKLHYDKLLLATGMSPRVPDEFKKPLRGAMTFGSLKDALQIRDFIAELKVKDAIIIGAGINGIELADVLVEKGLSVTCIDKNERILHKLAPKEAAEFIKQRCEKAGVHFQLNKAVKKIEESDNGVTAVILSDGTRVPCQIAVFTTGSKINSNFLKDSGIEYMEEGIVVDAFLRTNKENVYAAGDAILIKDIATGNTRRSIKWNDAEKQGKVAAMNMLGGKKEYKGSSFVIKSHFLGIRFASCGDLLHPSESDHKIYKSDTLFSLFALNKGILKAFLLAGAFDREALKRFKNYVETSQPVTEDDLVLEQTWFSSSLSYLRRMLHSIFW